jgi:hypothetical protein
MKASSTPSPGGDGGRSGGNTLFWGRPLPLPLAGPVGSVVPPVVVEEPEVDVESIIVESVVVESVAVESVVVEPVVVNVVSVDRDAVPVVVAELELPVEVLSVAVVAE